MALYKDFPASPYAIAVSAAGLTGWHHEEVRTASMD